MKKILTVLIILMLLEITGNSLFADEISTGRFSNVAIGGYDPVAYHLQKTPVKGSSDFSTIWKGAEWRFVSRDNLNLFETKPEVYAPIFGGFCANAMSEGKKVRGNPKIWRIYKENLYLFYSKKGRESWDADTDNKIALAIEYWKIVQFD